MAAFIVSPTFAATRADPFRRPRLLWPMGLFDGLFLFQRSETEQQSCSGHGLDFSGGWLRFCAFREPIPTAWLCGFLPCCSSLSLRLEEYSFAVQARRCWSSYKAFGYPVYTGIYILTATFILVILLIYKPIYTCPDWLSSYWVCRFLLWKWLKKSRV